MTTPLDRLLELRHADPRVTVLALSRNFGHQVAVTAGLDAAGDADAVIVMDTDLQDPPRVSLELVRVWEKGVDVVYAQRRTRRDGGFKRATAYLFYWLLARLASIDIPRNVGDFRGIAISAVSVVGAAYVVWVRVFAPEQAVPGWAFLGVGMFLLSGLQLTMMGVIGGYLGRMYVEAQDRPLYSLALSARGDLPGGAS